MLRDRCREDIRMEQKTSHIATMKYGAQVVKGELKSVLLDHGDTHKYDLDHTTSKV